eukprot:1139462-Pelagomonas_calceolata.AAC.9
MHARVHTHTHIERGERRTHLRTVHGAPLLPPPTRKTRPPQRARKRCYPGAGWLPLSEKWPRGQRPGDPHVSWPAQCAASEIEMRNDVDQVQDGCH